VACHARAGVFVIHYLAGERKATTASDRFPKLIDQDFD
jgi:hypothetical protein